MEFSKSSPAAYRFFARLYLQFCIQRAMRRVASGKFRNNLLKLMFHPANSAGFVGSASPQAREDET